MTTTAVKTGAQRTAESRERQRKADGYDAAVAEAAELREQVTQLQRRLAGGFEQFEEYKLETNFGIDQLQLKRQQDADTISTLQQQVSVLRQQLNPIARPGQPLPFQAQPEDQVIRCGTCGHTNRVPRAGNHVSVGDQQVRTGTMSAIPR